ncbi:Condensin-2 complex subunit G2 [Merluccius polli]|uniref:Condensin-2 complex subunit G2 n=1 Tax=Merluccius polli TaxID=89951 RepID=A0AA47MCK4_MERPO|nr:Condensin-2 complex subunit G2 [Merluccius polli]
MSKREVFVESVCREKQEDFLRFILLHKDKTDPFDVEEVLQELAQDRREALWGRLLELLQQVLLDRPPKGWEAPGPEPGGEAMEAEEHADPKQTVAVVEGVALIATVMLNVLQDGDPYGSLLECARQLHDVLAVLPVSAASLQQQIHRLCELWWKKGLLGKEEFGRTAFLLTLRKSLSLKKPGAEIQRLWELHEVLLGVDFNSEDNKQLVELLLECYFSMSYVRRDDGKRFLVFLFSWNVDFIWMIHATIKNQLQFFTKALTNHIAEIYFRAWKKATGDFLEKIESVCIQDLMQNAIMLHRTSPVHGKVRQIVSYFHKRKGCKHVDRMLYELYKPILWRALSAPNHEVRANATLLFTEAFAVHDPTQSSQSIDASIQKQLDTLMGLLDDPQPMVRSSATLGVCKILATCWELLPPSVITDFLKKLVVELAADCHSADVRCSVFKCLSMVLDNPLSHPLLEKLLPALKNSLHDTSEKVRSSFLDMLLKVKAVRAAKFWDVCNMEHLLARLALDSQPVSKRIVNLLFKSFFPVNVSEREWCCRCIALIQMNPCAARKFYQYAHLHTAPTNIVKLMLSIRRVLNTCLPSQTDLSQTDLSQAELSQLRDGNKENNKMEDIMSAKDTGLVASLLEVLVILWRSVLEALAHNKEAHQYTVAKFSSVISKYFNTFEDERCVVPLIFLASLMPPAAVPTFSCGVLSKLKQLDTGASQVQFGQLIDCLCGWGRAATVLDLITQWLSEPLPSPVDKAAAGRKVRIQETVEAKPDLGLSYLEYLLSRSSTRDHVLPLPSLSTLHKTLGGWQSVLYSSLSSGTVDQGRRQGPYSPEGLHTAEPASSTPAQRHESRDFLSSLELSMSWLEERVLPYLSTPNPGSVPGEGEGPEEASGTLDLAKDIVEGFVTVCRDMLLVGLGDEEFKGQILHLCSLILLPGKGYLCIPLVLSILKEVTENSIPEENQGTTTSVLLAVVVNTFQKVVELLARRMRKAPEDGRELCVLAGPALGDFLQVVLTWEFLQGELLQGVFSTLLAGVIVEIRHLLLKVSQQEELVVPESVEDLPPLSSILLSVVFKTPTVTRAFLAEVTSSVECEDSDCVTGLTAVLHILNIITHTGQMRAAVKSAAMCVQRQLQKVLPEHIGDNQRYSSFNSLIWFNC